MLQPLAASSFARGIPQSNAGIGPLAIAEAPDGSILVSGGAARSELYRFTRQGGTAGVPLVELNQPILNLAYDVHGNLWATTGGGPLLQLFGPTGLLVLTAPALLIGQAIARRGAHGFGMRVIYHNRSRLDAEKEAACGARYVSREDLFSQADHIVLVLPYTPAAHHTVGAAELARRFESRGLQLGHGVWDLVFVRSPRR